MRPSVRWPASASLHISVAYTSTSGHCPPDCVPLCLAAPDLRSFSYKVRVLRSPSAGGPFRVLWILTIQLFNGGDDCFPETTIFLTCFEYSYLFWLCRSPRFLRRNKNNSRALSLSDLLKPQYLKNPAETSDICLFLDWGFIDRLLWNSWE